MSPTASGQSKFIFVKFFFFYFTKTILTFRCLEANGSASSAIQNRRPRRRRPARKPIESASRPSAQPSWRRTKSLQRRAKRLAQPPQRLRWRHHRLADLPPPWLSNAASTRPSPRRRTLRPAGIKVNPFFHFFLVFFVFFFFPHTNCARKQTFESLFFLCHRTILDQLESHEEAWPFLLPVNTKQFPTYKKIIRNPMDLSTIRKKLNDGM